MHRPGQRWCSKSCAQAWRNGARPPYVKGPAARATRALASSRARRLRHAESWDGITDEEILERDGWRCQIPGCKRRPIRRNLKYPNPRSKSIDHIVPLSLGGDDTAVNKRAAHLGCNLARGNKAGVEQVALFGVIRAS
jgi:5-methylcytosine-specific restriction endonuclease McrA